MEAGNYSQIQFYKKIANLKNIYYNILSAELYPSGIFFMILIKLARAEKLYENSAYVSFAYNAEIVAFMQTFPEKYYHKETRQWEIPISDYKKVTARYKDCVVKNFLEAQPKETEKPKIKELPKGFKFITTPKAHQLETIKESQTRKCFLLADEPGCGKTKQIIDIARLAKFNGEIQNCLIVCGINESKWGWVDEIKKHGEGNYLLLGERKRRDGTSYTGDNPDKLEDIERINDELFVVTNIESLRNEEIVAALKKINFGMIAVDESHTIINPSADQSKGLLKLDAPRKIPMSGTPVLNKPIDIYTTLKWLGVETHNYNTFKNHYAVYGGFGGYQITGYKNMAELQSRVNKIQVRRLIDDCADLPPRITTNELLEMSDEQWKIYNEVKRGIVENVNKIVNNPNPLTDFIRLRQATSSPELLFKCKEGIKYRHIKRLLEECADNGEKMLIFSNWREVILPLYEQMKRLKFNPALLVGDMGSRVMEEKRKLNDDKSCKVMLGTIKAMGTTHNLPGASWVCFLDQPWHKAQQEQCVDRVRRIEGVTRKTKIKILQCKNTVDERVAAIVEAKGAMADFIVDGKVINFSDRKLLVDFLLS